MTVATARRPLIDRLPAVRGTLTANAPLHRFTWFRVGGPAEVLFQPADEDDLARVLAARPDGVAVTVLGVASNLLIRDGGIPGIVVRLGQAFGAIAVDDETVRAGAGALDIQVARACRDAGLAGLEFLCGVPGTIGGALRMNAGAYQREVKDVILSAEALDSAGACHRLDLEQLGYTYRHCRVPDDWIFVSGTFRGHPGSRDAIAARMDEISAAREASQPIRKRTGGSTFTNPPGHKAWELIDKAGCRGLTMGDAKVSEQHCNFLINTGNASAADLEALGEEVRRRVRAATGILLHWEIRRIGIAGEPA